MSGLWSSKLVCSVARGREGRGYGQIELPDGWPGTAAVAHARGQSAALTRRAPSPSAASFAQTMLGWISSVEADQLRRNRRTLALLSTPTRRHGARPRCGAGAPRARPPRSPRPARLATACGAARRPAPARRHTGRARSPALLLRLGLGDQPGDGVELGAARGVVGERTLHQRHRAGCTSEGTEAIARRPVGREHAWGGELDRFAGSLGTPARS